MSARIARRGVVVTARLVALVLAIIVAVAGVLAVGYRKIYNVWPAQAADTRVHWCGRDYGMGGAPDTWDQMSRQERFPVRLVAQYPPLGWPGQDLFAGETPAAQRNSVSPPLPCAMVVYLRTGPDAYQPYSLEGGP